MIVETDRIVKHVVLRAPHARVWRALTDSKEFGQWFGMRIEGPFVAGATVRAAITPTTVDAQIATAQKPYEGMRFELFVDRIEAQRLFSFRWHPYAIDPGVDYSAEPTTLVAFELEEVGGGVRLTVTESGFDRIPLDRRAKAFAANEGGWAMQMTMIEKYLAHGA
jgi:uncharacterized protein YndB with AHSA1/START domain